MLQCVSWIRFNRFERIRNTSFSRVPKEMNNLYGNPEYAAIQEEMKKELNRLKEEYGDTDEVYPELVALKKKVW